MQSLFLQQQCPDCARQMVDAGDELVCPACGVVREKEVTEYRPSRSFVAADFTQQALGSYLGSHQNVAGSRRQSRFAKTGSTLGYLKLISDNSARGDGSAYECSRIIERVSEKLGLSKVVMAEAVTTAKKVLRVRDRARRATLAAVSAYSLIVACKVEGVCSVSTREVLEAHTSLGRRVKVSSIIQLSLESDFKTEPKRAEDYLSRVVANLSKREQLRRNVSNSGKLMEPYLHELRAQAARVLILVGEGAKAGRRPYALAATAVYAAEVALAEIESRGRMITQKDVAECGETAEYTVREQFRQVFAPSLIKSRFQSSLNPLLAPRRRTGQEDHQLEPATLAK